MRKIIHIDMDCFYAAVEMRDDPSLRGQPIAVGGRPDSRGVVATCNYEARRYGVHSAMSAAQAKKLCPEIIFVKPRMDHYRSISQEIRKIFSEYTELIEPLSLDEAYLDVTDCERHQGSATFIAQAIQSRIKQATSLTASAGVAPNKFLAKIASDWHKPNGLKVITPDEVDIFVRRLPVRKIPGVGRVTSRKLADMGIELCDDLRSYNEEQLYLMFGSFGKRLHELSLGIDERPVKNDGNRKSVSVEETFEHDIPDIEGCLKELPELMENLNRRVRKGQYHRLVRKQFVKLKFNDFTTTTVERGSPCVDRGMYELLLSEAFERSPLPVRLIGIGVRLSEESSEIPDMQQLELTLKKQAKLSDS